MPAISHTADSVVPFPTARKRRYPAARISHRDPPEGVVSLLARRSARATEAWRACIPEGRDPEELLNATGCEMLPGFAIALAVLAAQPSALRVRAQAFLHFASKAEPMSAAWAIANHAAHRLGSVEQSQ
jgi:hypothetical protein